VRRTIFVPTAAVLPSNRIPLSTCRTPNRVIPDIRYRPLRGRMAAFPGESQIDGEEKDAKDDSRVHASGMWLLLIA